ncbi:GNAT family N-acetyltransferase [Maritalea porphyrae]|uniref:GNAT family N-acetyltransferase n=1 Tax=Maritalea porphyrae TaxID=880732 RepID=UPI0022AFB80E|nr:GNAT family N-acetyltransferase [Maritalea porphyrae]MCZ4272241.1 GNAT family N-acetyltransferase [Maritalea porphyrae]
MSISIRRLNASDAASFRAVRLEAFKTHPVAFGSSYDELVSKPVSHFEEWLTDMVAYGAFSEDQLVGIGAYFRERGLKMRHRAYVISMYCAPKVRGQGVGRQIIEHLADHARSKKIIQLHLGVGATNSAAKKSYEKAGFRTYGIEPRSLFVNEKYIDEELMVRFLDEAPEGKTV